MADFADTAAGFETAQALVLTNMASFAWVEGYASHDVDGHTVVRFIRFMSPTNPDYGAWTESRDDAAV